MDLSYTAACPWSCSPPPFVSNSTSDRCEYFANLVFKFANSSLAVKSAKRISGGRLHTRPPTILLTLIVGSRIGYEEGPTSLTSPRFRHYRPRVASKKKNIALFILKFLVFFSRAPRFDPSSPGNSRTLSDKHSKTVVIEVYCYNNNQ